MLLRSVTITDPASAHHGQTVDVRITDGRIVAIEVALDVWEGEEVFSEAEARLSPGFVDIGAYLGDPGHEEREDIESLIAAARAGGYTTVAVLPNTDPVRQSAADMRYLEGYRDRGPVSLLPLAALSRDTAGRDLTEMMELAAAGAVGFTDGPGRPASGGLLKRGLEYAKAFNGTIIDSPYDVALAPEGQIHEGAVSVQLGLPGIPVLCETIPLTQALTLLHYTDSRLVLHLLSTAEGTEILRQHPSRPGCTVSAHHLTFTDEELTGFDPNYKVMPPLRGRADREALRRGIIDGTITAIASHHRARHREEKELEFSYSAFGALGLQTSLRQLLPWAREAGALDAIISALTAGPRHLLDREPVSIAVGQRAECTLFTTKGESTFTAAELKGKTRNSPLLDRVLPGKILATINHDRLWTSA